MIKKPSDFHSCLTDERIDHIGQLIARVRAENLEATEDRDIGWSIGCRAHAWIMSEITNEAQKLDWLDVVDPSLRFIGSIGHVEFSFYRGMANKPNKNIYSRAQSHGELRQKPLLFETPIPEKLVWVYAVETDLEGATTNIEFFGMSESGDVVASRVVPIFNTDANLIDIAEPESAPVELLPATAKLPKKDKPASITELKSSASVDLSAATAQLPKKDTGKDKVTG